VGSSHSACAAPSESAPRCTSHALAPGPTRLARSRPPLAWANLSDKKGSTSERPLRQRHRSLAEATPAWTQGAGKSLCQARYMTQNPRLSQQARPDQPRNLAGNSALLPWPGPPRGSIPSAGPHQHCLPFARYTLTGPHTAIAGHLPGAQPRCARLTHTFYSTQPFLSSLSERISLYRSTLR